MRAAPTVLLFVVQAASALQPVSVQRRALLGGAAAALVATSQKDANAAGLEQFKLCGNQMSDAAHRRSDVVSVAASARWRGSFHAIDATLSLSQPLLDT